MSYSPLPSDQPYPYQPVMPEYNFILAGRVGVGKSTLFRFIKTGIVPKLDPDDQDTSACEDYGLERLEHETEVNGREVKVNLWDTGGQERYDSMTANYFRHAHAVILVYDLTAEDTLFNLTEWIGEARKNSRWSDRLVIALWGNKSDVTIKQHSSARDEAILAFMSKHNISLELSAKVSTRVEGSVERAFQSLIEQVDKKFHQVGMDQDDTTERDLNRLTLSMDDTANQHERKCACLKIFS